MESAEATLQRLEQERIAAKARWDSDHALQHLVLAFQALRRIPERGVQRDVIATLWPDDAYAKAQDKLAAERFAADLQAIQLGDEETIERHRDRNRVIIPPSAVDISRMYHALRWPILYVENRDVRVMLLQSCLTVARHGSLREMCEDYGWKRTTVIARVERAGRSIATGLNKDGVSRW